MNHRLHPSAGIAIGPILFVLALLGVIALAMGNSVGSFSGAGNTDRVTADILSQVSLIRAKINECNLLYGTNNNGDGWPASDPSDGTIVSDLECEADPAGKKNLWTGMRDVLLPPPTKGFNEWYYMNAGAAGGRCIWTSPIASGNSGNNASGLKIASNKFSSQELSYDPASSSQKFVIFITRPTGTVDTHCEVP